MNRIVTTYCTSCWIPAVGHVVSFIAAYLAIICLCLYKPSKNLPDEITWPVTVVLIIWAVISWFIIPLSVIINLCKKHWLKSVIAIFLGSLATSPVVLFVLYVRVLASWH